MRLSYAPLGVVGLLAVAVVALGLLQGRLTVVQAGQRALVVLVVLVAVDRVLVPVARLLVGPRQEPEPDPDPDDLPTATRTGE